MFLLLLYSVIACMVHHGHANDAQDKWLYPPTTHSQPISDSDPVWLVGSNITLQWVTNITSYNITLFNEGPKGKGASAATWSPIYIKNEGDPEIGIAGFNWTVQTYGFDYTDALGSPVFFLAGGSPHGTPGSPGFTSCFINFTNNANDPGLNLSSSTTTLPTSTASPSDTTTSLSDTTTSPSPFLSTFYPFGIPTTTATPTPFSTSTPAPTPTTTQDQSQHATPSHTKLSTGVKAAIGIATVIGFLIMLLLAWMVFRREQRLKRGMVKLKEVDAAPAPPPTDAPARSVSARSGHGTDNAQAAMAAGAVRPVRDAQMAQTARDALGIRSIPGVNDGSAVQDGPAAQDGAAANNGITLDRIHSSREPPQQVEATADSKEEEIMMTPVELQADEEVIPQELPAHGSTPKERWRRFTGEDEGG